MTWTAHLHLQYDRVEGRMRALDRHVGPLRVLKAAFPEGPGLCEHVLVHPPGGLAGGDELSVSLHLGADSQVRLTTPGATRLYRSTGAWAHQTVRAEIGPGAWLEWLPLETLAHGGCRSRNRMSFALQPGARLLGWDIACLGLPASGDPFAHGELEQHLEIEGIWLERGRLAADDAVLRESSLGLAGHPVWATMWCAAAEPWEAPLRERLLDAARLAPESAPPAWGATSPDPRVVVVRGLAQRVEPLFLALRAVRRAWLPLLGRAGAVEPRIWRL